MNRTAQTCTEMDTDLLMHGLGELPYWRSWAVSRHLTWCGRCRKRQDELISVSRGMAETLMPPSGGPRLTVSPVTVAGGWLMIASIVLILATSILILYVTGTRLHVGPFAHSTKINRPCLPGLASDKCR
jgi:hypothetical protein